MNQLINQPTNEYIYELIEYIYVYIYIYFFLNVYIFFINLYISIHTMHTSIANKQYKDEHVLLTSAGFSFVHFMSHCETAVRPSCAAACAVPREHQMTSWRTLHILDGVLI